MKKVIRKQKPALDPNEREKQMISYAVNLAEEKLLDGTASSQVITHFLKLGSSRAKTEQEMLELQKELIAAKTEAIHASAQSDQRYEDVLQAIKRYGGHSDAE